MKRSLAMSFLCLAVVSLAPGSPKVVSDEGSPPNLDIRPYRRCDGRTGVVALSGSFRQGWGAQGVDACSSGKRSALECQGLFSGVTAVNHCPAKAEAHTDVDDIAITLADQDEDGAIDIVLTVRYAIWPALTPESALKLDLASGCAVEVSNPPDASVPVPESRKGTVMLVFLNRDDRFEPTPLTRTLMKALDGQDG